MSTRSIFIGSPPGRSLTVCRMRWTLWSSAVAHNTTGRVPSAAFGVRAGPRSTMLHEAKAHPCRALRRGLRLLMTNTRPRRRTICDPGCILSDRRELRTFMIVPSVSISVGVDLPASALGGWPVGQAMRSMGPSHASNPSQPSFQIQPRVASSWSVSRLRANAASMAVRSSSASSIPVTTMRVNGR